MYILAEREFPSGNAGGTHVRYLSKALQCIGHEVIVLSLGENDERDYVKSIDGYVYDGIQYDNFRLSKGIARFFRRYVFSGVATVAKLKRFRKSRRGRDIVIIYTSNALYAVPVLLYTRNKYSVWMDIVEWYQKEHFPNAVVNIKYWLYQFCFYVIYPATRKVIAISSLIQSEFMRRGCTTILVPNLYDTRLGDGKFLSDDFSTIKLIYSGNPGRKENIVSMLKALVELPAGTLDRFQLHFTGVKAHEIVKLLGEESHLLESLRDKLIFHPWMNYEDLLELYTGMHFLYFVREPTISNLANFPTKLPELMTFGVVPLTNPVGDYGKYLTDGIDSILIRDSSYQSCRDALDRVDRLDADQLTRLRNGARECARGKFDFRIYGPKIKSAGLG